MADALGERADRAGGHALAEADRDQRAEEVGQGPRLAGEGAACSSLLLLAAGCSTEQRSEELPEQLSEVTVVFGSEPERLIRGSTTMALLETALAVQLGDKTTTVYLTIPRTALDFETIPIGTGDSLAPTLWAKDEAGGGLPLVATSGSIRLVWTIAGTDRQLGIEVLEAILANLEVGQDCRRAPEEVEVGELARIGRTSRKIAVAPGAPGNGGGVCRSGRCVGTNRRYTGMRTPNARELGARLGARTQGAGLGAGAVCSTRRASCRADRAAHVRVIADQSACSMDTNSWLRRSSAASRTRS